MKSALIECTDTTDAEIFIVEGPTAASAVEKVRDRRHQAVLPMQGKIPNAVRSSESKLIQHPQIADLLHSLHMERRVEFAFNQFRYQRVVLLNDPDVDGVHAGVLLILFLFRYLPELIEQGRLYSAPVPLYRLYNNSERLTAYSDKHLDQLRERVGTPIDVTRFKSVASVDKDLLIDCLSVANKHRRQLSMQECSQICAPFLKS